MLKMLFDEDVPWRWLITRVELRLADIALVVPIYVLFLTSTSFQPTWGGSDGVTQKVVFAFGSLLGIVGRIWMRRIARGNPEPEANDQFWWSRA
jgi:hypothetical protein